MSVQFSLVTSLCTRLNIRRTYRHLCLVDCAAIGWIPGGVADCW